MSNAALIAEAESLRKRADDLWKQSEAMTRADYAAAGLTQSFINGDICEAAKPLHAEGHALRARAEALLAQSRGGPPAPAAAPAAAPIIAQSTNPAIDATVAAAVANFYAGQRTAAAPVETAAQIAAREVEARAVEADELVALIVGDPTIVARSAAERKARLAEESAAAAAEPEYDYEAAEKLVAEIIAA